MLYYLWNFKVGERIECMTCIVDQTLPSKFPLQPVALQVEDVNVIKATLIVAADVVEMHTVKTDRLF